MNISLHNKKYNGNQLTALLKSAFLKLWVGTQMWAAKAMRIGHESLYVQLLLAKGTISLDNLIATNTITAFLNCVSNF